MQINSVTTSIRKDRPAMSKDISFSGADNLECYQTCFIVSSEDSATIDDHNITFDSIACGFYATVSDDPFIEYSKRVLSFIEDLNIWLVAYNKKFITPQTLTIGLLKDTCKTDYGVNEFARKWTSIQSNIVNKTYTIEQAIKQIEIDNYRYSKFIKSIVAPITDGPFNNILEFVKFLQSYLILKTS